MTKRKLYLILEAALCVLLAGLLCASAVSLYREGASRRAEDPLAPIYTRELVAAKLAPIAPIFYALIGLSAAGLLLGIKGEATEKRVAKPTRAVLASTEKAGMGRSDRALRAALILAAIALIILGIFNGSARDVLYKAANICTECIGLG